MLRINLLAAKDLHCTESIAARKEPDTYAHVAVEYGGRVLHRSSQVVKTTTNPSYQKKVQVPQVFDEMAEVRISIYHHHAFSIGDKVIGFARFRLRDLAVPPGGREVSFAALELQHGDQMLQLDSSSGVSAGSVSLKISWLQGNVRSRRSPRSKLTRALALDLRPVAQRQAGQRVVDTSSPHPFKLVRVLPLDGHRNASRVAGRGR